MTENRPSVKEIRHTRSDVDRSPPPSAPHLPRPSPSARRSTANTSTGARAHNADYTTCAAADLMDEVHRGGARAGHGLQLVPVYLLGNDRGAMADQVSDLLHGDAESERGDIVRAYLDSFQEVWASAEPMRQ